MLPANLDQDFMADGFPRAQRNEAGTRPAEAKNETRRPR